MRELPYNLKDEGYFCKIPVYGMFPQIFYAPIKTLQKTFDLN